VEKLWRLFYHLGNSLGLDETLATFDAELRAVVEFSSISIHLPENGVLAPVYLAGLEFQRLPAFEISRPARDLAVSGFRELKNAMAAPLEQVGGVVAVHGGEPFSDSEFETFTAAVPKLQAALRNVLAYRNAAEQAGLAGAAALFRKLDAELSRCVRESTSLAILACRIDGEREPRDAAWQRLRGSCREYDFAVSSGDELILVLAGFTRRDLPEKQSRIEEIAATVGVSARVGAAFFPEDGKDAEDLLATASRRVHA
jgi:hypothetical protein